MTTTPFQTIANALEKAGILLGDVSGIASPEEFARLVTVACANRAAGKRGRGQDDDDDDLAGLAQRAAAAMRE